MYWSVRQAATPFFRNVERAFRPLAHPPTFRVYILTTTTASINL